MEENGRGREGEKGGEGMIKKNESNMNGWRRKATTQEHIVCHHSNMPLTPPKVTGPYELFTSCLTGHQESLGHSQGVDCTILGLHLSHQAKVVAGPPDMYPVVSGAVEVVLHVGIGECRYHRMWVSMNVGISVVHGGGRLTIFFS